MKDFYLLFVYGTLKQNCRAHGFLKDSIFVGEATTKPLYSLYSCLTYPALVKDDASGTNITGEVYKINSQIKKVLDQYEGVEYGLYTFEPIKLTKIDLKSETNFVAGNDINAYIYQGKLTNWEKIQEWTCF